MTATIPLAKGYSPEKLKFPVYVSEKLDGVPVRIDVWPEDNWHWTAQTRQGEPAESVRWLVESLVRELQVFDVYPRQHLVFVAEVTHCRFTDFKDISGVVRRQTAQDDLILNIFDYSDDRHPVHYSRFAERRNRLEHLARRGFQDPAICVVHQHYIHDQDWLDSFLAPGMRREEQEGWIIRSHDAEFKPGSRHWDYQKYVVDPCVDLRITGFEEAVSATGEPLGMVGRIIADFRGQEIGVGPGKLSHEERRALWVQTAAPREHPGVYYAAGTASCRFLLHTPAIATVKYKRDPSYTALRQPTFQHWRPEKTEPSYE